MGFPLSFKTKMLMVGQTLISPFVHLLVSMPPCSRSCLWAFKHPVFSYIKEMQTSQISYSFPHAIHYLSFFSSWINWKEFLCILNYLLNLHQIYICFPFEFYTLHCIKTALIKGSSYMFCLQLVFWLIPTQLSEGHKFCFSVILKYDTTNMLHT